MVRTASCAGRSRSPHTIPRVAKALFDLHNAAVAGALDPHVRELAILVACRETNYSLEWNAHEPAAVKAGVDRKTIDVGAEESGADWRR